MYSWEGVPNIVLGQSFCMAMFVKCVWMSEPVLGDGVEESSV